MQDGNATEMQPQPKRPRGRPTRYTRRIANEILRRLAAGETLSAICRTPGMPPESTVRQWVIDDRDGFAARYARARDLQVEHWADEIIEIADDGSGDVHYDDEGRRIVDYENIHRSRLRVDTRKWLMSKLSRRYGEWRHQEQQSPQEYAAAIVETMRAIQATIPTPTPTPEPESESGGS